LDGAGFDVVALLDDLPAHNLTRGQVGTVVESLDDETVLIDFSNDEGRTYAIAPLPAGHAFVTP
jgi:hypothetical protein